MLNRELLNKIFDKTDELEGIVNVDIQIYPGGAILLWVTPRSYFKPLPEEDRHKILAAFTPFVGKIELVSNTDYKGEKDGVTVYLSRAKECKTVGYKIVKKTVRKEIEREPEYEEVEEEVQQPITDCDIKAGRASESDIEVPA